FENISLIRFEFGSDERVDFVQPGVSVTGRSELRPWSSPMQVEKLDTVLPTSQTKERKPEYKIICEPAEGEPQHLVGEFKLTDVVSRL
ncbi:unnamed protein product, partial [Timema podura]|nr:unnamed protein product [Timema podura]